MYCFGSRLCNCESTLIRCRKYSWQFENITMGENYVIIALNNIFCSLINKQNILSFYLVLYLHFCYLKKKQKRFPTMLFCFGDGNFAVVVLTEKSHAPGPPGLPVKSRNTRFYILCNLISVIWSSEQWKNNGYSAKSNFRGLTRGLKPKKHRHPVEVPLNTTWLTPWLMEGCRDL